MLHRTSVTWHQSAPKTHLHQYCCSLPAEAPTHHHIAFFMTLLNTAFNTLQHLGTDQTCIQVQLLAFQGIIRLFSIRSRLSPTLRKFFVSIDPSLVLLTPSCKLMPTTFLSSARPSPRLKKQTASAASFWLLSFKFFLSSVESDLPWIL